MKKILSLAAAGIIALAPAMAQEAPATVYTPQAGDFGVGVDLVPVLRTIGGGLNDASMPVGGNPFTYDEMYNIKPTVSVNFKYMCTDHWALKFNVGVLMKYNSNKSYTTDDLYAALYPEENKQAVDIERATRSGATLMVGGEYHLGSRRVQGIFGFGIIAGVSTWEYNYHYGNAITELNQRPSASIGYRGTLPSGYRVTTANGGPNGVLGAYGTIGAEWFVAPRISLGAEVNLALYGVFSGKGYERGEGWSQAYGTTETFTQLTAPGNSACTFGTENLGGALNLTFYF